MPKGVYKHQMGEKSSHWRGGPPHCSDCGKQISRGGHNRCIKCYGKTHIGKYNVAKRPEVREKISRAVFKGDDVGYSGIHMRVRSVLGIPHECAYCGSNDYVQWASISHKALRDINDYFPLCLKCHQIYDDIHNKGSQTRRMNLRKFRNLH